MGPEKMMSKILLIAAAGASVATVYAGCYSAAKTLTGTDYEAAAQIAVRQEMCPASAPFFAFMGCAAALVFACLGAAYGTAPSGVGVANMGVLHADMVMKSNIPVVMAGVLGIYGLIVAVLLGASIDGKDPYNVSLYSGYSALAAGLCCGMAGLSAGIAIGIVGDAGVRANARQSKLFVGVILILIFAEALGLYGLIVALILSGKKLDCSGIASSSCFSASK